MTVNEIDTEIERLGGLIGQVVGTECLVYSRVVGYYQPLKSWNPGKKQEFEERKLFEGLVA